ncbi:alpha/beta hydrolase [Gordonia sp. SCSIO 19800]|uniref:alpha/beta hydrolase n=1 Tax=Gordonia sp. SCSIO 19800 TaxID=2826926 RepID=UPI001B814C2F|nr:alpha/beta hydrolase [Gordonia sp. SCSIO 19800]MBR7194403.1 alpha/beta hydrolase [Gordonia sp. SCSIO 19800]
MTGCRTGGEDEDPLVRARNRLAAVLGNRRARLDDLRNGFDAMMLEADLEDDVSVADLSIGDVPALRVQAGPVTEDRVLVWFHGGGYVIGSPRGYQFAAAALSRSIGAPVVVPDYRLAPEHPFPAAVDDATTVVDAIIAEYGPENTVIGGDSAGGGLSVAVLVRARDRGLPLPAAAVVVSPLADFTGSGESITSNRHTDPVITERSLRDLRAAYLGDTDAENPLASPVFADLRGLPPILFLASDSEILLDDAVRLHRNVQARYGSSVLSVYSETFHAWTLSTDILPRAREGVAEIGAFVGDVLRRAETAPSTP